jgi:hypothetical protein
MNNVQIYNKYYKGLRFIDNSKFILEKSQSHLLFGDIVDENCSEHHITVKIYLTHYSTKSYVSISLNYVLKYINDGTFQIIKSDLRKLKIKQIKQ